MPTLPDSLRLGAVDLTVPTSTAPSPGTSTRSACACTPTTPTAAARRRRRDDRRPARGPAGAPAGRHAGLYHYALLYPSREELARAAVRLAATRTPIEGASDHGTHEAIYLPDADGNGIELAADRPREQWPDDLGYAGGPEPLDIDGLLATVAARSRAPQVGEGLRMGHLHLHVGDIDEGLRFYRDVLGFEVQAEPRLGRVRLGRRLPPPPRLQHLARPGRPARAGPPRRPALWTVELPTTEDVDAVRSRLSDTEPIEGGFRARDPWGTAVRFVAA